MTDVQDESDLQVLPYCGWPVSRGTSVSLIDLREAFEHTLPMDALFGVGRGLPVDRVGIHRFLEANAKGICGHVLEVQDAMYTEFFGGDGVTKSTIVDIDPKNQHATLIGDILKPDWLEPEAYDSIIFLQWLQTLPPMKTPDAIRNLWRALRPGGEILMSISSVGRVDPGNPDYWRLNPIGLQHVLEHSLPSDARIHVEGWGNDFGATTFLRGLAVEDLVDYFAASGEEKPVRHTLNKLNSYDFAHPVLALARIRKSR